MAFPSKRKPAVWPTLTLVFAALLWLACDNSKSTNPAGSGDSNITASKVTAGDCKQIFLSSTDATPADQDCLQFSYGVDGVLRINRFNAGFNCCPDSFRTDIDLADNVLTITESEYVTSPCRCLCLYDLEYSISGLAKDKYWIKVVEPYVTASEDNAALEFQVDFSKTPSGEFCVFRLNSPWAIDFVAETPEE